MPPIVRNGKRAFLGPASNNKIVIGALSIIASSSPAGSGSLFSVPGRKGGTEREDLLLCARARTARNLRRRSRFKERNDLLFLFTLGLFALYFADPLHGVNALAGPGNRSRRYTTDAPRTLEATENGRDERERLHSTHTTESASRPIYYLFSLVEAPTYSREYSSRRLNT